jgi:hypothetical protein
MLPKQSIAKRQLIFFAAASYVTCKETELENTKRRARRASETEEEKLARRSKRNEQDRASGESKKECKCCSTPRACSALPLLSVAGEETQVEQNGEL